MNNNISKCWPVVVLLLTLSIAGGARADEDDAFSLVTSASWQYQDNVLYLPDGQRPTFFGSGAPRGDHNYNANVGLNFDKRIGRQQLSANATRSFIRYNSLDVLDYDGHSAFASWKWQAGNDLSGQLRYTSRRYLQGFGDFRTTTPAKNLIDVETLRFDAAYIVDAYWTLFGALSQDSTRNDLRQRQGSDSDLDRIEAGVRYTTRGGTAFELLGRDTQGDYPKRLPGLNVTNSFSQKDLEARVRWQPVGHSRLSASIGQSNRRHDEVPERDYEDVYGRVSWEWQPTGKLGVNFLAERQISALDDLLSSYFRTTTYSISPMWQPTGKLRVDGRMAWISRDGNGETFFTQFLPAAQTARQEDITTYSLGATWFIQRNLSANAELRHDSRDSNVEFYQYRVRSLSMSLQYLF
jgi:exopolysaccharide biosynthesis operon protein EpsL